MKARFHAFIMNIIMWLKNVVLVLNIFIHTLRILYIK